MSWPEDSIRHYRKEADALTAEIDRLTDPVWLGREIASKEKRRDQWLQLADELTTYANREPGLFGDEGEAPRLGSCCVNVGTDTCTCPPGVRTNWRAS